ncbi:MAG TPA: hypothetical protein VGL02_16495 [Streptomyces sp.]
MIAKTAAKTALLAALALASLSGTVPASAATGAPAVTITLGLPGSSTPADPDPSQADPDYAAASTASAARADTVAARSAAVVWHSAISEASGLRIRKSHPSGRVLDTVPRYGAMWVSCKQSGWYRVAYHGGRGWICGWSSASLVEINPDASIPQC